MRVHRKRVAWRARRVDMAGVAAWCAESSRACRGGVWLVLAACIAAAPLYAIEVDTAAGRWRVGGYVEGYAIIETDRSSPRQRPEGIVDLDATGDLHPTVRLRLETRFLAGGPPEEADGFGVYNLHDVFQNVSPSVDFPEAYVDLLLPQIDLRVGIQKFAWGRLDTFHPTDVFNPRDYRDPFLTDENDAKIGLPSVAATYFQPEQPESLLNGASVSVVWVPLPVPVRFPLEQERWFPPAASVPPVLVIPPGTFATGLPGALIETSFRTENAGPVQRLDQGAVGLRLMGLSGAIDWSLYFYDGRETAPAFDLETSVRLAGAQPEPPGELRLDGDAVLRPRFGRIWLAGGDAALPLAGVTVRAEAAYGSGRLLPRSTADLLALDNVVSVVGPQIGTILEQLLMGQTVPIDLGDLFKRRDTIEWGVGVDYPYRGWTPVLQINQTVVLNNDVNLLLSNVDTRLFGALRRSFLAGRLTADLVGFQGLERSYTTAIARMTYAFTDSLRLRIGYLLIAGSRNTIYGQYKDNDEVFFQLRYSH